MLEILKRLLDRPLEATLGFRGSLEAVVRGPNGREKGRRLETDEVSLATDVFDNKVRESVCDRGLWQGKRKKQRELAVAARFIESRNAKYSSQFGPPFDPEECAPGEKTWDAFSHEEKSGQRLKIQVVMAETDQDTQKALQQTGKSERNYKLGYVQQMLRDAISKKAGKYDDATRSETVLLLEGWPAVTSADLAEFRTALAAELRGADFKEIWFVGPEACPVEQLI